MIFWNKTWSPICGHYFWDNPFGATKFCEQLGCYSGGEVLPNNYGKHSTPANYTVDAFRFGACRENDNWGKCTGGCNDDQNGGSCYKDSSANCKAGQPVAINITCSCSCTKPSSCTGIKMCNWLKQYFNVINNLNLKYSLQMVHIKVFLPFQLR